MRRWQLLGLGLVALAACNDGGSSENSANSQGGGNASASGTVYGMTPAPDSQRVEIAGATITLIRVGDFPAPVPGPDTTVTPPGGDTLLTIRHGLRSLLDTVISPPDTTEPPPPPPGGCEAGTTVATAVSGSDGRWSTSGLEEGVYNVIIDGPAGGKWSGIEYCGYQIMEIGTNDIDLYLQESPGPDPVP